MFAWLINFAVHHDYLVYLAIIPLATAEGPIVSLIGGVLLRLGILSFFPLYGALMLGDLIGDALWYQIGRSFGMSFVGRFGKYFSITEHNIGIVEKIFHKHKYKILFISKISNGLGLALVTLMTAGMTRIPFLPYLAVNTVGQFIWSGALIGIGFFFSNLYISIDNVIARISIAAAFILLVLAFIGFTGYLRKRAEKNET